MEGHGDFAFLGQYPVSLPPLSSLQTVWGMEAADKDTLERELSADVMLVSLCGETSQELV